LIGIASLANVDEFRAAPRRLFDLVSASRRTKNAG
jgi:hypothetical protein